MPEKAGEGAVGHRLGARFGHAVYGRDVDAVYTARADEDPGDRHPLADESVEPVQDELQGDSPIAQRPGRVLRDGAGFFNPLLKSIGVAHGWK